MTFKSILYADTEAELKKERPAFFQDLQLNYLLEYIEAFVKGYNVKPYYYTILKSASAIRYRQQVCRDLADSTLLSAVTDFCNSLQSSRKMHELALKSEGVTQAATYHLQAASIYWDALSDFDSRLDSCSLSSDGLLALHNLVKVHMDELNSKDFGNAITRANEFFSKLCFQLTITSDRITIDEEETSPNNYLQSLAETLGPYGDTSECHLKGIFPNVLEPSYLEAMLIDILRKNRADSFEEIQRFRDTFPDFYSDILLRFEQEAQFYISFMLFKERTAVHGYDMCIPDISEANSFNGCGVYDIALVWKHSYNNYTVVSNDFTWKSTPSFFVVTGPNQGGKTTFARSMGQAVYFSMLGLYANASSLTLPLFEDISTHFEAEELLQSNSGKLKEEINRLKPMMQQDKRNNFVILNELFTTATTHDAQIMGRKVMEHFLSRDCYGIYVTHIQELAEETDSIISLVAQVEQGEDHKRTYRMLPMKAQGYGYSDSLIKEFNLSYEDIKRRLS